MLLRVVVVALVAVVAAGCGPDTPADDGRVQVVAGFYPLAEAARRVGGALVRVDDLTPAGVEPHDLEVTSREVDKLEDADVILYVGGGFQPAIDDVAGRQGDAAVDLRPHGVGSDDPHFWLDPVEFRSAVDRVADALAAARPSARATFERRAATYDAELTALDAEMRSTLSTCERTTIVTSHAAFGHLARRYGLRQEAISGLSPESEPDPDRLSELADLVERTGTTTVFSETLVSPKVARTLAREAGVRTAVLDPLEGLSPAERRAGDDYLSIMRRNLRVLADALGCRS